MTLGLDEWTCVELAGVWHPLGSDSEVEGFEVTACGMPLAIPRAGRLQLPRQVRFSTEGMCHACAVKIGKAKGAGPKRVTALGRPK